jgi:hypothetical protein
MIDRVSGMGKQKKSRITLDDYIKNMKKGES